MADLTRKSALAHRSFIGPAFGAGTDGPDPQALTYAQIVGDARLTDLAQAIYAILREQFADPGGLEQRTETPEEAAYRQKLEGWVDILEILLEETLVELENLNAAKPEQAPGLG
jgi:hypothetical protein